MNGPESSYLRVQQRLIDSLQELSLRRGRVRFLLATDEFIEHERRVAFAPEHVERLAKDLTCLGIECTMAVISGAGERTDPPLADSAYAKIGARVLSVEEAAKEPAFDVVHALKEPTPYEATLAGPFLRIGALHLASKPPGVCELARQRNVGALLDGATVGNCSYLLEPTDRTPIVGSMSRFAGAVAGRKVVEGLVARDVEPGRMIIVGGGIAGRAAMRQVGSKTTQLVVVEPWEPTRLRLEAELPEEGFADLSIVEQLTDDILDDAVGIVFAHRSGARAAEKVVHIDQIRRMRSGAAIADIAIDQGGSIAHADYEEEDDAAAARRKYIELLGDDFTYYAEVNMPREEPGAASLMHGYASLPYITALLALCAHLGGPAEVIDALLERPVRVCSHDEDIGATDFPGDFLSAIMQDLRNGTQLVVQGDELRITDPDVARDANLANWLRDCASHEFV